MKFFYPLLIIVLIYSLTACRKKTDQAAVDEGIITKYISDHNLSATATGSGLYYVSNLKGTGATPNINSNVTVKYTGYLTNGTVFDQTNSAGATFNLSGVIKGWQEGIPLFNKGGKGKLLIPSALGYGAQTTGQIPANSVLIFDVEILDVR